MTAFHPTVDNRYDQQLRRSACLRVQDAAFSLLFNLSSTVANKQIVSTPSNLGLIVSVMDAFFDNASVQGKACALLGRLAAGDQSTARVFSMIQENVIPRVLRAQSKFPDDVAVQADCALAIRNLAMSDRAEKEIVSSGGMRLLFLALHNHTGELAVLSEAAAALVNLSCDKDSRLEFEADRIFGLRCMTRLIQRWVLSPDLLIKLVRIIRNLASTAERLGPPWLLRRMVVGDPLHFYVPLLPHTVLKGCEFVIPPHLLSTSTKPVPFFGPHPPNTGNFSQMLVRSLREQSESRPVAEPLPKRVSQPLDEPPLEPPPKRDEAGYVIFRNRQSVGAPQAPLSDSFNFYALAHATPGDAPPLTLSRHNSFDPDEDRSLPVPPLLPPGAGALPMDFGSIGGPIMTGATRSSGGLGLPPMPSIAMVDYHPLAWEMSAAYGGSFARDEFTDGRGTALSHLRPSDARHPGGPLFPVRGRFLDGTLPALQEAPPVVIDAVSASKTPFSDALDAWSSSAEQLDLKDIPISGPKPGTAHENTKGDIEKLVDLLSSLCSRHLDFGFDRESLPLDRDLDRDLPLCRLNSIDLSRCGLDEKALLSVFQSLRILTLQRLYIAGNVLGENGSDALCNLISDCPLLELHATVANVDKIFTTLCTNTSLKRLNLQQSVINPLAAPSTLESLKQLLRQNACLSDIVAEVPSFEVSGLYQVSFSIVTNITLQSFDLTFGKTRLTSNSSRINVNLRRCFRRALGTSVFPLSATESALVDTGDVCIDFHDLDQAMQAGIIKKYSPQQSVPHAQEKGRGRLIFTHRLTKDDGSLAALLEAKMNDYVKIAQPTSNYELIHEFSLLHQLDHTILDNLSKYCVFASSLRLISNAFTGDDTPCVVLSFPGMETSLEQRLELGLRAHQILSILSQVACAICQLHSAGGYFLTQYSITF